MIALSDKQLELNQKLIDLIYEFNDTNDDWIVDGKDLMKFIWNKGYVFREKDNTIYGPY